MKAIQGDDNYRQLLAAIATNNISTERLFEVTEMALYSICEELYFKNDKQSDELHSDLVDVYLSLLNVRMMYNTQKKPKLDIKVVK